LIIAHEAVTVGGFGAEVAATIGSACFSSLKHPVVRLGSPRVPISYAPPLEDAIRVTSGAIALAAEAATS
jgi:pyruvate dehydrogenase E1 component beta subunit